MLFIDKTHILNFIESWETELFNSFVIVVWINTSVELLNKGKEVWAHPLIRKIHTWREHVFSRGVSDVGFPIFAGTDADFVF